MCRIGFRVFRDRASCQARHLNVERNHVGFGALVHYKTDFCWLFFSIFEIDSFDRNRD
jgi:hypothetical protein